MCSQVLTKTHSEQKCSFGCQEDVVYAHFSDVFDLQQYLKRKYSFQSEEKKKCQKRNIFKQTQNNGKNMGI